MYLIISILIYLIISNSNLFNHFTLICFQFVATTTIYLPALPDVMNSLHTDQLKVGLTISIYSLLIGVMPLFYGPISDRHGRRKVLLFGMFVYVITSILCGLSPTIEV